MQDPIDDWMTAGGLTLTGALASLVVWARKARLRIVSGKDIAEMNASQKAAQEASQRELRAIKEILADLQTDIGVIGQGQNDMRVEQAREFQRVSDHERRLDAGGL